MDPEEEAATLTMATGPPAERLQVRRNNNSNNNNDGRGPQAGHLPLILTLYPSQRTVSRVGRYPLVIRED